MRTNSIPVVKILAIFLIGNVLLSFYSCSPEYLPNMVNTPLFEDEGEIQASGGIGLSGYDLQLAYAATDHIGVMANSSFLSQTSDTTDEYHKHDFFEVGVGYYTHISDNATISLYGGYGLGNVESKVANNLVDEDFTDASFHRLFVQPSIGIATKHFDASLAPRLVFVDVEYSQSPLNEASGYQPLIEPVLTTRFGFENVKFITQAGLSFPFISDNLDFDTQPFMFSIGLHLNFDLISNGDSGSGSSSFDY